MNKILVTGATGFIGNSIIHELCSCNEVHVITAGRNQTKLSLLKQLYKVETIHLDIHDKRTDWYSYLGKPDIVLHLAWGGLPNYKALYHFETELPAQYRFLKALVQSGLRNLIVTGTCFEYGMQSGQLDEDLVTKPVNPYGFAKDTLRRQLEYLKHEHPFNLTWARLFYLYGEGQSENSLLPQLKRAVFSGSGTFNMSGGEQLRDYLTVAELAKYLVPLAMKAQDTGIVNVCSGKPISVRKLVENCITENNLDIKLNLGFYPYPDYEPMAFWGNNHKLQSLLDK